MGTCPRALSAVRDAGTLPVLPPGSSKGICVCFASVERRMNTVGRGVIEVCEPSRKSRCLIRYQFLKHPTFSDVVLCLPNEHTVLYEGNVGIVVPNLVLRSSARLCVTWVPDGALGLCDISLYRSRGGHNPCSAGVTQVCSAVTIHWFNYFRIDQKANCRYLCCISLACIGSIRGLPVCCRIPRSSDRP